MKAVIRFNSRRGVVSHYFSDNGTNFFGLSRIMKTTWTKITEEIAVQLATQEVTWEHIPPYAPTSGGLWEACMKSLKFFTKRHGNISDLTYEDFNTLICKIEGILNSRPLYPSSSDPSSGQAHHGPKN
jgi:hypothetical protein